MQGSNKRCKKYATAPPPTTLENVVNGAAVQSAIAAFDASRVLDNAGLVHSEIVTNYPGDSLELKGLDVLRAAYDVSKGFISEYDPPLQAIGVSTVAAATAVAIAIAQWISDKAGTAEIGLIESDTFVQDTLTPQGYWP